MPRPFKPRVGNPGLEFANAFGVGSEGDFLCKAVLYYLCVPFRFCFLSFVVSSVDPGASRSTNL